MQIKTVGKNRYAATFNKRSLQIDATANPKAIDTGTGEHIDGHELRSIKRLVEWHVKSGMDSNELQTFWTIGDTRMNKYLAFDIEIFKSITEGVTDWKEIRPLGISCVATIATGDAIPTLWHSADKTQPMTVAECRTMLSYMAGMQAKGYKVLTWNGLSFDFDILAEESQMQQLCADLAMSHIDMMFHFFCLKGFPVGLDTVAKGCGLPGKTVGVDGAKAPDMWAAGEYEKVLEYVGQDVVTTLAVAETVERQKGFEWTAKSGRPNSIRINEWKPVKDCLTLPEPDNSWMTDPWQRSKFAGWMQP